MSDPSGPDPFKEGLTLFKSGKYQEASELFLQIVTDDEENHKAWNALGVSLSKAGDRDNAKICFDNALALDPDNSTYQKNLDRLQRPKAKPIQKPAPSSKDKKKPAPKKGKTRPITDYLLAGGGIIFVFFFYMLIIGIMAGPVPPSEPGIQPVQTITPVTAIPTLQPTAIPPTVSTPIQTPSTPVPTVIVTATPSGPVPMTIRFLDVGQGDSILIQAGGKNMLIDVGPSDSGPAVVSALKTAGVSTLDVVVATHQHEDHIGGMFDVLTAFPVLLYVDNGQTHTTKTYETVMTKLRALQTPYAEVTAGKKIPFAPGIDVSVLGPATITGDQNNDSIVLKITDGSESFLFMGDASSVQGDVKAQVLKVGHHGSAVGTSSAFLSRVKSVDAIIMVGAGNSYGHPSPETISNLQKAGAHVYRTDTDGTITVSTDGKTHMVTKSKTSPPVPVTAPVQVTPRNTPAPVLTAQVASVPAVPIQSVQAPGPSVVCDCSGNLYNCNGKGTPLPSGVSYQQCFDYCKSQGKGDVHDLDRDNDGRACE